MRHHLQGKILKHFLDYFVRTFFSDYLDSLSGLRFVICLPWIHHLMMNVCLESSSFSPSVIDYMRPWIELTENFLMLFFRLLERCTFVQTEQFRGKSLASPNTTPKRCAKTSFQVGEASNFSSFKMASHFLKILNNFIWKVYSH